jgi:gliding motility-associated-like protein
MLYEDRGTVQNPLLKSVTYQYVVKTVGKYGNPKVPKPLPNLSPIAKGTMIDSTVPCSPILKISTPPCDNCESYRALINPKNFLTWSNSNRSCDSLVKKYLVYYKPYAEDTAYTLIASTLDTFLYHSNAGSLAGCYYIRSLSLSDISSPKSEEICIDNCFFAELPNVFTPNGDTYNNVFRFTCVANTLASEIDVKIYNRWGNLIYEGPAQPESLWEGKSGSNIMDDGLYYFYVNLNYIRLHRSDEKINLKGWVMLLRH